MPVAEPVAEPEAEPEPPVVVVAPVASLAWLERALEASPPVREERTVVEPMVEVMTLPSEVMVLTIGSVVTAVWGREVAPGTPPTPKRVVSPVEVMVDSPLVMTVVKVEVETGLGVADSPPPEAAPVRVVTPRRVVRVLPPEVISEKIEETTGTAVAVTVPVA